jgi:hypothetical protein
MQEEVMILKPPKEQHKSALEVIERELPKPVVKRKLEDPAIRALREASILPKRELVLIDRTDGDEVTPAEAARRAFEDQGLSFAFIAMEVNEIIRNSDPVIKMKAIEFATKILANNVSGRDESPLPQPVVNINIMAHTKSGGNKNAFDILIPE